jgi:hypothetical protein
MGQPYYSLPKTHATIAIIVAQFNESNGPKGDPSIRIPGIDQMSLRLASSDAFHDIRMGL